MGTMIISFPQYLFKSPNKTNIENGKEIASLSKILFCGIARNVGKTLSQNIKRLNFTGHYFKEHAIFVYENDSSDNTVELLKTSNIQFLSENRKDSNYWDDIRSCKINNHSQRCKVLAECRNKYLDYAKQFVPHYDYLCVIDFDIRGWSYKGFFDSIHRLETNNNLACVSSYGVLSNFHNTGSLEENKYMLLMYDSFAMRLQKQYFMTHSIQSQFNYMSFNEPTTVRSNFNGLAIYKLPIIINHTYESKIENDFVNCDHVCINEKIEKSGYDHLLNPYLVTSYSKHRYDYA